LTKYDDCNDKNKSVGILESYYRLIIVIAALGTFLFYMVLFPPPTLNAFPDIAKNLSTIAVLFLWIVWGIYLSFFLVLVCLIFASPNLILRKHRTKEVTEGELFQRTKNLSSLIRLKKHPKILLEESPKALCMVFGTFFRQNRFLVSTGLLENLKNSELDAVLLHELSHIKNRDVGIATWGDYLKSAIKYAIVVILALRIVVVVVDAAYGFTPDVVGAFIDLPSMVILTLVIPVFVINSGLRKRESLADARAILFLNESSGLKSAMAKTVLINYKALSTSQAVAKKKQERIRLFSTTRQILANFIEVRFAKFFIFHPTIKQRILDINEERHIFYPGKIKPPGNEAMVLSGIVGMYILPVGLFLIAFPVYLAYYWISAVSSLLLLVGLFGVFLFFVAPGIVIFLPIYESIRMLDRDTFKGLSKRNLLKYIVSFGKAIIVASLTFFIFSLLAFTSGNISIESLTVWLVSGLGATVIAIILLMASLILVRRRKATVHVSQGSLQAFGIKLSGISAPRVLDSS
jgi:Zn-dependent protease with chaperone function